MWSALTEDEIDTLHHILGKLQYALRGETAGGITPELADLIPRNDIDEPAVL